MKYKEYQKRLANFIEQKKKCIIAVDMGLGKTLATLAWLDWFAKRKNYRTFGIIIAPKRVAENNWQQEMLKFGYNQLADISVIVKGSAGKREDALADCSKPIKIIGRDNIADLNTSQYYDFVVFDELTSYKNIKSKRYKVANQIKADYKIGLTGTLLANGAIDIYAQAEVLDIHYPHRNFYSWRADFFRDIFKNAPVTFEKWELNVDLDILLQPIKDNIFTLSAEDWLEIPEKTEHIIPVELEKEIYKNINELNSFLSTEINGEVVDIKEKAKFAKLQTMCNGFVYDDDGNAIRSTRSTKLNAVVDKACEIVESNERVLIFYAYREEEAWLKEMLTEEGVKVINVKDDDNFIEKWNNAEIDVLLAHPASAGHGLNLQYGGRNIIWSTLTYNYEFFAQGNARLARQGQTGNVQIYYFIASGTIEERVVSALTKKSNEQQNFVELTK